MAAVRASSAAGDERKKYVEAWNKTMVDIWRERIEKLKVIDTGSLWQTFDLFAVDASDDYRSVSIKHAFNEYGIWQDLGVGREVPHGNPGDIGRDKVREAKKWYSLKYFSSVMNIKEFMAENLGKDAVNIICEALDASAARKYTEFYRRKGY